MTATLRARLAECPLKGFALALYARPGIESACLRLQDEAGVDVCELLWRCWLLQLGLEPDVQATVELAEIRHWQHRVTLPLRRLRRSLKTEALARPGVAKVRETLKRAELEAELETLARLEELAWQGPLLPLSAGGGKSAEYLADSLQLQKKSHLSTLGTVIDCLDRPSGPR